MIYIYFDDFIKLCHLHKLTFALDIPWGNQAVNIPEDNDRLRNIRPGITLSNFHKPEINNRLKKH